jgi:dihydroorotate dehydrogenase electron transfer subunit
MSSSGRGQFIARVVANVPLCREHFRLVLVLDEFPATEPGVFVQVSCRDPDADQAATERIVEWDGQHRPAIDSDLAAPSAMLRRPFSLAGRRDTADGIELDIIHRVVGIGTQWLSELKPGGRVGILGPLGNTFTLPAKDETAVLVGGGVGIPPMLYLAEKLAARRAVAFSGALTRDLIPLTITGPGSAADEAAPLLHVAEFARHGIPSIITTDDGSYGFRGFVTQALEQYLDARRGQPLLIYTCGPEPMMKRVADIAAARDIDCQIAVERAMACGMGTCQSCCIRVRKPDPSQPPLVGSDWCYRLACTDGPVFRGADLLW